MTRNLKLSAASLAIVLSFWLVSCVTQDNPDGSQTTSIGGVSVVEVTADGEASVSPGVEAGAAVAGGLLPQPWGGLVAFGVSVLPWLLNSRARKQLIVKPSMMLASGDIGGAVTSVLAGVGIGHSEPDPLTAFGALRAKLVTEGKVDQETGLPFAQIAKAAPTVA